MRRTGAFTPRRRRGRVGDRQPSSGPRDVSRLSPMTGNTWLPTGHTDPGLTTRTLIAGAPVSCVPALGHTIVSTRSNVRFASRRDAPLLSVSVDSFAQPAVGHRALFALGGRWLRLVEAHSTAWGTRPEVNGGK